MKGKGSWVKDTEVWNLNQEAWGSGLSSLPTWQISVPEANGSTCQVLVCSLNAVVNLGKTSLHWQLRSSDIHSASADIFSPLEKSLYL